MYTQNKEEEFILNYFGDFKGTLLDIGANDGKTFSNSLALIEKKRWQALLIEPNIEAFNLLQELHKDRYEGSVVIPATGFNPVQCLNVAIGNETRKTELFVNNPHLTGDVGLLGTIKKSETIQWGQLFNNNRSQVVEMITWADLIKAKKYGTNFDFITIDAEGMDIDILKQIDLTHTKLLCIEWNSIPAARTEIVNYCNKFGMTKTIYQSPENLLICRP